MHRGVQFISTNRCDCTKHNENAHKLEILSKVQIGTLCYAHLQLFWHLSNYTNYCLSFTVKHCLSKFIITDASYWTSPYCIHSHNGICKENWVVLNVCPTKVEKPWENKTIRWQIKKMKQKKKHPILLSIMMHNIAMNTLILMKQWASMKWVV